MCSERDAPVVSALCPVLLLVQDLNDRVTSPLGQFSFTPDPDDDLMELPEDCRVMVSHEFEEFHLEFIQSHGF